METVRMLSDQIEMAAGHKKAKLVLKNARIINVFTELVETGDVAIADGKILGIGHYSGEVEINMHHRYLCPGFIDGHIHIESSMMSPEEFEKASLPHGTTAAVTDPHEIANVAGTAGIDYMLECSEGLKEDIFVMMPSCVPSTPLDESGAELPALDIEPYYSHKRVLGLAEMMNSFGVVHSDPSCLDKIRSARNLNKRIDGHAPALSGEALNAYVAAGITSDHECVTAREAIEKLARGQWIMIREGTAAHNLEALLPLFKHPYCEHSLMVTDDAHPGDLLHGHIDEAIRKAIQLGAPPVVAIKMASYNAASCFNLQNIGAIAPGYQADIVVVNDLRNFEVTAVYKKGELVAENGKMVSHPERTHDWSPEIRERVFHSFHCEPLTKEKLRVEVKGTHYRVIELLDQQLITKERIEEWKDVPEGAGTAPGVDIGRDIVKVALMERHHGTGHVGLGFLGNYGLKKGAVASSIGHDSHNLIVAGTNDEDMIAAANRVIENEGGLAVACGGRVLGDLQLKIGGLMSEKTAPELDAVLENLKAQCRELGVHEDIDPFMTLGFASLVVIPEIRISTWGPVDVMNQKTADLFCAGADDYEETGI